MNFKINQFQKDHFESVKCIDPSLFSTLPQVPSMRDNEETCLEINFYGSRSEMWKVLKCELNSSMDLSRYCICIMKSFPLLIIFIISMINYCLCQPTNSSVKRKFGIVGGKEADIEDYPYQCAFLHEGKLKCGCSVISRDCFLTAGK